MKMFAPVHRCHQCGSTAKDKHMVRVLERKSGKLTGKYLDLCPKCRVKFFNIEIQKIEAPDEDRTRLLRWNHEESKIWTPD